MQDGGWEPKLWSQTGQLQIRDTVLAYLETMSKSSDPSVHTCKVRH